MIEKKYISVQKHPTEDLYIYNYTQRAQFDKVWNEETLQCRGLILNKNNQVIARPFSKFFNFEEHRDLPIEEFEVFDKLDGSLGITYFDSKGHPNLATRGSFTSDQAIKGTEILHRKYPLNIFSPKYTYLFEIIYPENRIVVDYKGMEDIILLSVIDTKTAAEVSYKDIRELFENKLKIVERFDSLNNIEKVKENIRDNSEGFVIRFKNGIRVKLKYDEYVRLHRLVTGVNAKTIWDLLRNSQSFDELLNNFPDEYYQWITDTKNNLISDFKNIEDTAIDTFNKVKNLSTRKEQALWIKDNYKLSGIIFAMLDKKPHADMIWKLIKPKLEKPYKEEI